MLSPAHCVTIYVDVYFYDFVLCSHSIQPPEQYEKQTTNDDLMGSDFFICTAFFHSEYLYTHKVYEHLEKASAVQHFVAQFFIDVLLLV